MHYRNRLLAALPAEEQELLSSVLTHAYLDRGAVLWDSGRSIQQVCFPENALVSMLSVMSDGTAIETAMVGRDGMVGLPIFHGVDRTALHAFVQIPGEAFVVSAREFATLLPRLEALQSLLHRYAVALLTMVAQSSACNRKHSIECRCARWLLTVHDGVDTDHFEITQQFLSQMLGVRRATVTGAAGILHRSGLISYSRGRVTVSDRDGLEQASCDCYRVIRSEYDRLLGGGTIERPFVRATSENGHTIVGDGGPTVAEVADLATLQQLE
jgi:CRP-like cAMP-binding protein